MIICNFLVDIDGLSQHNSPSSFLSIDSFDRHYSGLLNAPREFMPQSSPEKDGNSGVRGSVTVGTHTSVIRKTAEISG